MKKTICVVTGTRAEYGLLKPLLQKLLALDGLEVRLLVTGTHLCPEFGFTLREIEEDGFLVDEKMDLLLSSDSPAAMAKSTGLGLISFGEYFQRKTPDLLLVLGDRFEIFACATAAAMARVPIAHLYGGDTTQGAVDEFLRHAITKMSYLHFTASARSRDRVIQLGESPQRVWNVGSLGVENILRLPLLSRESLEKVIGWSLAEEYALVTFHPVTLEDASAVCQLEELLGAVSQLAPLRFLFTKANADAQGRTINRILEDFVAKQPHCIAFASLGSLYYLSAMQYATLVIGNSSSGLYEAPSFHIPTVNIGDRQKGRLQADSVLNCPPGRTEILAAVRQAVSRPWRERAQKTVSPFGDGTATSRILPLLEAFLSAPPPDLKKQFYDLAPSQHRLLEGSDGWAGAHPPPDFPQPESARQTTRKKRLTLLKKPSVRCRPLQQKRCPLSGDPPPSALAPGQPARLPQRKPRPPASPPGRPPKPTEKGESH